MAQTRSRASARRISPQDIAPNPAAQNEQRRQMIAEAAYFRALSRNFEGGDALDDWLAAEREVDSMFPSPAQRQQELLVYDKLRREVTTLLAQARDTLTGDTVQRALQQARERVRDAGEHAFETIERVMVAIEKDVAHAAGRLGPKLETISETSSDVFAVWRNRSNAFLTQAGHALADWLRQAGHLGKAHRYRSGEAAGAGEFQCSGCKYPVRLDTPAHLPACPQCGGVTFTRQ